MIVGSGFGGSIAALRLAEAGRRVVVLERGRTWAAGDFPRDPFDGRRLLWREPERAGWRGLYDLRFHSGIATLAAAGVGGGSLIYANVLTRPDARVFDERWPPGIDGPGLSSSYAEVEALLTPEPIPDRLAITKDRAFSAAAARLGRSSDLFHPNLAVDWPDETGSGCQLVAECEFGCRFGAKRTLDRTLLATAAELGTEVRTEMLVRALEPLPSGRWRVHAKDLRAGIPLRFEAGSVVVSAGTLRSTELLLRCRDEYGLLPGLSQRLGERFSGNGDFIGLIRGTRESLEPWRGPDVTAVLRDFDLAPGFTVATPTFAMPVMSALAATAGRDSLIARTAAKLAWPWLNRVVPAMLDGGLPTDLMRRFLTSGTTSPSASAGDRRRDPSHATAVFAIGRDSADGTIVLRHGRGRPRLDVVWGYRKANQGLIARMEATLAALAGAYGGELTLSPTWTLAGRTLTVHPLGGCAMATGPRDGVVSPDGAVFGYPGLYVIDGSVIPNSIGFHPALTIAAVSNRSARSLANSPA